MLLRQVIELFDLLDTPAANGTTVTDLFKERGNVEVTVENVKGDEGDTDCVTILIKGSEGKSCRRLCSDTRNHRTSWRTWCKARSNRIRFRWRWCIGCTGCRS